MKIIAKNKKARFNYELLDDYEAGISLLGSEVKSIRSGKVNIGDAYVKEEKNELFIQNMRIANYDFANRENHNPFRIRKLLLHKREIKKIGKKIREGGLTVVPLSIYFNNKGKIKIKIALAKGKKLYDKRQTIKEREENILLRRTRKQLNKLSHNF